MGVAQAPLYCKMRKDTPLAIQVVTKLAFKGGNVVGKRISNAHLMSK